MAKHNIIWRLPGENVVVFDVLSAMRGLERHITCGVFHDLLFRVFHVTQIVGRLALLFATRSEPEEE
jgi:hypothetical protein